MPHVAPCLMKTLTRVITVTVVIREFIKKPIGPVHSRVNSYSQIHLLNVARGWGSYEYPPELYIALGLKLFGELGVTIGVVCSEQRNRLEISGDRYFIGAEILTSRVRVIYIGIVTL